MENTNTILGVELSEFETDTLRAMKETLSNEIKMRDDARRKFLWCKVVEALQNYTKEFEHFYIEDEHDAYQAFIENTRTPGVLTVSTLDIEDGDTIFYPN